MSQCNDFHRGEAIDSNVPEQEQKAKELLQNLVEALRQKAKQVNGTSCRRRLTPVF